MNATTINLLNSDQLFQVTNAEPTDFHRLDRELQQFQGISGQAKRHLLGSPVIWLSLKPLRTLNAVEVDTILD